MNNKTNWANPVEEVFSFVIFLRELKAANLDFLALMKNLSKNYLTSISSDRGQEAEILRVSKQCPEATLIL